MRRQLLIACATITAALAGCVGDLAEQSVPENAEALADWALRVLTSEHDHTDPALHANITTPNFKPLGWSPLLSAKDGHTAPGAFCGDAKQMGDRRLAVVEGGNDVAFTIADVTNPAEPKWVGEFVMRTTDIYDLTVTPDGRHAVLATLVPRMPDDAPAEAPEEDGLLWRAASCDGRADRWIPVAGAVPGEDYVPRPMSIVVVNIEDPAKPTVVDHQPLPGLPHSVEAVDVDGRTLVVASSLSADGPGQQFTFFELLDTPVDAKLLVLSTYGAPLPPDTRALQQLGGHNDAWIATHPKTGATLAYLASAWAVIVLDITDPRLPREVGTWTDYDPARVDETGSFHSLYPLRELWDGRHFTIVGPEFVGKPGALPTGVIYVLDTTDPADPVAVGAWTFPHEVVWEKALMWSPHYLTVSGKTAFVSMYHGGIWALDLTPVLEEEFTLLEAVGAYLPTNVSPAPPEAMTWSPRLGEVMAFDDGTLATFDSNSGLYTFRFDETDPAPPAPSWPLTLPEDRLGAR